MSEHLPDAYSSEQMHIEQVSNSRLSRSNILSSLGDN